MEAVLKDEFGQNGPVCDIPSAGRTDKAITHDLLTFYGMGGDPDLMGRFLAAYFRRLPTHLKGKPGAVLPGVPSLLERLSAHEGVTLGLLTGNFREGARLKLDHYGLSHHFLNGGGFGDDHFDRDDVAREAYQLAGNWVANLGPERVWVVGDTPADIRCGRAIGAKVVAVATGMFALDDLRPHEPDYLLRDLTVTDWVDELLG